MSDRKSAFIDVQALVPKISLEQAASHYGVTLPELKRIGEEVRSRCFLNCGRTEETGNRALAIQIESATKIWKCFQYGCAKGGNLVGLCDLMKPGENAGGRPRGERFKEIARDLQIMVEGGLPIEPAEPAAAPIEKTSVPRVNRPLADSENERARELVDLDEQFVVDSAQMPPEAAGYFRKRSFLTPDTCRKYRIGYLPRSGRASCAARSCIRI